MEIRTTVTYPLTPVWLPITKKSTDNKCWWGCGEEGTLVQCWWESKLVWPLWKMCGGSSKNKKWNYWYHATQQFHSWVYLQRKWNHCLRDNLHFCVHCSIIYISQDMESPLVAQTVNNLPAMQDSRVWSLDWGDPLEKEMATTPVFFTSLHFQYSYLEDSTDRGAWRTTVHGVTKSQTQLRDWVKSGWRIFSRLLTH